MGSRSSTIELHPLGGWILRGRSHEKQQPAVAPHGAAPPPRPTAFRPRGARPADPRATPPGGLTVLPTVRAASRNGGPKSSGARPGPVGHGAQSGPGYRNRSYRIPKGSAGRLRRTRAVGCAERSAAHRSRSMCFVLLAHHDVVREGGSSCQWITSTAPCRPGHGPTQSAPPAGGPDSAIDITWP